VEDSGDHEVYALAGNAELDAIVHRYLTEGELPAERVSVAGTVKRPDIPVG
jgi:hypothetical protein